MVEQSTAAQLRRGVIGPCILAVLSRGSRYGLQLVKDLEEAGQLLTSQGTIYPLLNRMQEAGLVDSRWDTSSGTRPRRYYEITDDGRIELATFRSDWSQFSNAVTALVLPVTPTKPKASNRV